MSLGKAKSVLADHADRRWRNDQRPVARVTVANEQIGFAHIITQANAEIGKMCQRPDDTPTLEAASGFDREGQSTIVWTHIGQVAEDLEYGSILEGRIIFADNTE